MAIVVSEIPAMPPRSVAHGGQNDGRVSNYLGLGGIGKCIC